MLLLLGCSKVVSLHCLHFINIYFLFSFQSSNLLSAVLCLVKELDYPSLEVVEMAVKCRMDELED